MGIGTKACTRCGQVKLLTEYAKDNRAKTGTQSACKCCQAEVRKERIDKDREVQKLWRQNNPEKVKAISRKHYQNNKEKRRQQDRERYWANPDTRRKKAQEYRALNHEAILERLRLRTKEEREQLAPRYVAKVLQMRVDEIPERLMALKAEHLEIIRLLRPLKQQLRKAKDESSQNTN